MSEFSSPFLEGGAEPLETPELMGNHAADQVKDAMLEFGGTAELEADEANWLESLLDRMFHPILDVLQPGETGYDTETLSPADVGDAAAEESQAYRISEAAQEWHMQEGENSCAICSQQFIINEFLDLDVSEEELCVIAQDQGWFDPAEGTAPSDVGNLLEHFGIDTQTNYEGSIQDIKRTFDQGGRVIVAVDSMALWVDGFGTYPIYGADHAIEVIGIDDSDPLDVQVIVNDSGIEGRQRPAIPYLEFMEAWAPSGGFMVSAFPGDE